MEGKRFQDILTNYPGFALIQKKNIDALVSHVAAHSKLQSLVPWTSLLYDGTDEDTTVLVAWVNRNLFRDRTFKQPQLFICAPADFHKTLFVRRLATRCRIYWAPHEDNFDNYSDEFFDLIVFDEFRAKDRPLCVLNTILDGGNIRLKQRYMQTEKTKNLPCIILSNYTLEELYKNEKQVSLLRARLEEHILSVPIDIDENLHFTINDIEN